MSTSKKDIIDKFIYGLRTGNHDREINALMKEKLSVEDNKYFKEQHQKYLAEIEKQTLKEDSEFEKEYNEIMQEMAVIK